MNELPLPERPLRELHLFAGAGGGILGGMLLGHTCVCAVEIEPYCQSILLQRQRDGILPRFPIWDDVTTFDGRIWRGEVDVVCGGFPCQDISTAGGGDGLDGKRSGLWFEMLRIIGEVRPQHVLVENSPALTLRGGTRVSASMAAMGYVGRSGVLGAVDAGAHHSRKRMWFMANTNGFSAGGLSFGKTQEHTQSGFCGQDVAHPTSFGQSRSGQPWFGSDPAEKREGETDRAFSERIGHVWGIESPLGRVANGVADRLDRLKAIGNGQVPCVAALAWETLREK